jgi:hypothetical protein
LVLFLVLLVMPEVVCHVVVIFALLLLIPELVLLVAQAALVLAVPLMEALVHEVIALVDVNEVLTMRVESLMVALMMTVEPLRVELMLMVVMLMVVLKMMAVPSLEDHVNVVVVVEPLPMWVVDPTVVLLHQVVVACIVVVVVVAHQNVVVAFVDVVAFVVGVVLDVVVMEVPFAYLSVHLDDLVASPLLLVQSVVQHLQVLAFDLL